MVVIKREKAGEAVRIIRFVQFIINQGKVSKKI